MSATQTPECIGALKTCYDMLLEDSACKMSALDAIQALLCVSLDYSNPGICEKVLGDEFATRLRKSPHFSNYRGTGQATMLNPESWISLLRNVVLNPAIDPNSAAGARGFLDPKTNIAVTNGDRFPAFRKFSRETKEKFPEVRGDNMLAMFLANQMRVQGGRRIIENMKLPIESTVRRNQFNSFLASWQPPSAIFAPEDITAECAGLVDSIGTPIKTEHVIAEGRRRAQKMAAVPSPSTLDGPIVETEDEEAAKVPAFVGYKAPSSAVVAEVGTSMPAQFAEFCLENRIPCYADKEFVKKMWFISLNGEASLATFANHYAFDKVQMERMRAYMKHKMPIVPSSDPKMWAFFRDYVRDNARIAAVENDVKFTSFMKNVRKNYAPMRCGEVSGPDTAARQVLMMFTAIQPNWYDLWTEQFGRPTEQLAKVVHKDSRNLRSILKDGSVYNRLFV
jgi:hypothetical protein